MPPPPNASAPEAATASEEAFLLRVAELLHAHGTPAHRLERVLSRMARHFGITAQFLSTPTSLIAAFGTGAEQRVRLLRIEPGIVDLGRLIEFDELLEDLEDGRLELEAGLARLEQLARKPPRHGAWITVAAYAAASGGAAVFFGGGAREAAASLAIGLVLGLLSRFIPRYTEVADVFDSLSAFLAAVLTMAAARRILPLSEGIVTLSSLIVLIPGLSFTVAMIELATRHLVSGASRLAGTATVFLAIALGAALGRGLASWLLPAAQPYTLEPFPGWMHWPALTLTPIAFAVLFQARLRELPWILAAGWTAYGGVKLGSQILSPELGSFAGALLVGILANFYARVLDRPASVPLLPGILMLVPGSIGFRALDFFLAREPLSGLQTAFQMLLVATALVGGLLFANVILPPRRSL